MGTRFLATNECPIPSSYKQRLVDAQAWDPEFRDRCLAPPKPEEYARIMGQRDEMDRDEWLRKLEQVMFNLTPQDNAGDLEGDWSPEVALSIAGGSLAVGVIDKVVSVKELIDTIIRDAEEMLSQRGALGRLLLQQ